MPLRTLRLALRRLRRHPVYAVLNGVGLAIGLAVFLLIALYVYHEHTYDTYHPKAERTVRVGLELGEFGRSPRIPMEVATRLAETYPDIETLARLCRQDVSLRTDGRYVLEKAFFYADPSVFDVFDLPMQHGAATEALKRPDAVVLSHATAQRLFGTTDVVGETLERAEGPALRVTGVLQPLPSNTHLAFDALISYATLARDAPADEHARMFANQGYTYFVLAGPEAREALQAKLDALIDQGTDAMQRVIGMAVTDMAFFLQPLTELHLASRPEYEDMTPPVDPRVLWMFGALGVFILGIAITNYVNLATAQATRRATEVGVRKTMGAHRSDLVRLFLGEALVLSLFAVGAAALLIELLRPFLSTLLGTSLAALSLQSPSVWAMYLGTAGVVAVLAGSYPAWVLTRYQPATVMRGPASLAVGGRRLRQTLVVFQFAAAAVLIVLTVVVRAQVDYALQKPLGYDTEGVVSLPRAGALGAQMETLQQEAERIPGITAAGLGLGAPAVGYITMMANGPNGDGPIRVHEVSADAAYADVVGFSVVAGRPYTARPADSTAVLVNETAALMYGLYDRLDEPINDQVGPVRSGQRVVGIVRDFHTGSFREPIRPTAIAPRPTRYDALVVRIDPAARTQDVLASLETLWYTLAPNEPFQYQFAGAAVQAQYEQEQVLAQRLGAFALLAVLVAGLGLFGLAAFTAEQRTKEMSIRKVLGASVPQIMVRLNREFIALIGIACVIALPLAVWAARQWLQGFAYRMELSPALFAGSVGLILVAALLPVSYHALRAATSDPASMIRDH